MMARDAMAEEVHTIAPDETVQAAAQMMAELGQCALLVESADALEGILTERDIIIRVVAAGRDGTATRIREIMSTDLVTCPPDAPLEQVARDMAARQIRRMPVVDSDRRLIGLVTLDDPTAASRAARAAG